MVIERRMVVMTSNNEHLDEAVNEERRSTGKTRKERREKEIVRADNSEQTVVSNKTASSVLACTWICWSILTGVESLTCLGTGTVGLNHFQNLSVLLQSCCTWETRRGRTISWDSSELSAIRSLAGTWEMFSWFQLQLLYHPTARVKVHGIWLEMNTTPVFILLTKIMKKHLSTTWNKIQDPGFTLQLRYPSTHHQTHHARDKLIKPSSCVTPPEVSRYTAYLLFLTVKSSSEGFLSGFLLGSSFFMFLGLLLLVSYKKYTDIGILVQSHFRSTQKTYKTLLTSCHFIPLWSGQVDELGKKCNHPQTLNVTLFHFDQQMIWLFSTTTLHTPHLNTWVQNLVSIYLAVYFFLLFLPIFILLICDIYLSYSAMLSTFHCLWNNDNKHLFYSIQYTIKYEAPFSIPMYSTSFWQRAAEGRRGGAGRRQLRLQGWGVLGGSSGPHIGLPLWAVPHEDG